MPRQYRYSLATTDSASLSTSILVVERFELLLEVTENMMTWAAMANSMSSSFLTGVISRK